MIKNGSFEWETRPEQVKKEKKPRKSLFKKKNEKPAEEETKPTTSDNPPTDSNTPEKKKVGRLNNIDIQVPKGKLCMIVGAVGSGKSNLLNAIIGEMKQTNGSVEVTGTVAYCSQQAWIQNATLKENILFGRPFDKERYEQVIDACSLRKDLEILPNGENTEMYVCIVYIELM